MNILNKLDMGLKLYPTENLELICVSVGNVAYGSLTKARTSNKPLPVRWTQAGEGLFLQAYSAIKHKLTTFALNVWEKIRG